MAPGRRSRAVPISLALLIVVVFGLPLVSAAPPVAHSPGSVAPGGFAHPPGLRPLLPSSSGYWYTQEGATLGQENGSSAVGQLTDLVEQLTLVISPYPIGYELNGLSTTGDWYQVLVADNWGGCNAGFEMTYEVWNNVAQTQAPVCDPALTLSAGDVVKLTLSFPSSTQACLDAVDLTSAHAEDDCLAQPDTGAHGFSLLGGAANSNGYFTGPMTEIANPTPTSCPDYTNMPVIDYRWPTAFHVTTYYPFSDEFEYGGSGTYCYSSSGAGVSISTGDPTSHVVDTASGTSYGPHYIVGQNFTYINASFGWRLLTDPAPLSGVTVMPSTGTYARGSQLDFQATVSGGIAPRSAMWAVNGVFNGSFGLQFNWTALTSGTQTISAYGVDGRGMVDGPANAIIDIPGALAAGPVTTSTSSGGADIGQSIVISSQVVGGLPPYQFLWSGLPAGCSAGNSASLLCTPSSLGNYTITLTVADANGTRVDAAPLAVLVSPAFSASATTSRLSVDVGQTYWINVTTQGGAGPVMYIWGGVPSGCSVPTGAIGGCAPADHGIITPTVTVTDHNGVGFNLTPGPITSVSDALVQLSADRATADAGVAILLTAQVTGGAGTLQYSWAGLPTGCTPTEAPPSARCSFPPGTWEVFLNVTDSNGFVVRATPVQIGIFPALVGNLTGGGTVVLGNDLALRVAASGGSGAVSYIWQNLPPGCPPPVGGDLSCMPGTAGVYNVTVVLTDAGGGRLALVAEINVTAPASSDRTGQLVGPIFVIGILGGLAAVVVATVVVARRRRRGV